eukprot:CAMPEP_0172675178 /NCGR_PEP_ID=MMETSP1074-20121228/13128_1 /TAXON_ID=2916 /ORGANISM="Ceratium fusus, Strain PA161109" /LENGTH=188 /DNA_ID=CAMNT_0013492625 /DNA_START=61 /DNA_END=627 /DNA_ORIENTATION=+
MASYYEKIDGVDCDRAIVDACREAVKGAGDGRVSVDDAQKVFAKIADGGVETQTERWTMRYCLTSFKFTEAAMDWMCKQCPKVKQAEGNEEPAAKKPRSEESTSYYEKVDGLECDRAIVDACRTAIEGKGDGRVSLDDAKEVFAKVADGGKVTCTERWTMRYCLTEFNWTEPAADWIIEAMEKVPQES